jgi:hypothetical protein
MTDPATLLALADRCEQAAGPDRELDQDITKLLVPNNATHIYRSRRGWSFFVYDSGKGIEWLENQPYTASLNAAVTLYSVLPEVIPSCPRKASAAALRARAAMVQPSSDT